MSRMRNASAILADGRSIKKNGATRKNTRTRAEIEVDVAAVTAAPIEEEGTGVNIDQKSIQ